MRLKNILFIFVIIGVILVGLSISLIPSNTVQAQCKNVSSCKNCHEIQGVFPVANNGLWHSQHALYDFCDVCHGGDKNAPDKLTAHVGIKTKFSDLTQSCTNCHASDLDKRINSYSTILGVQVQVPSISAACTPTPGYFQSSGLFISPLQKSPTISPLKQPIQPSPQQLVQTEPIVNKTGNTILKVILGLILLGGFIFIYQNEKYHFMPSNKERTGMVEKKVILPDRDEITRKIDRLSPESQAELGKLLDDPAQVEKILHNLSNKLS
jgi:hypothetical protein